MKKITILFLLFVSFTTFSQEYFEGVLKFKVKFHDKTGQMSDQEQEEIMGTEQTYYLKEKKYKSELNGKLKLTTYHEGKDTLFAKMNGINSLMYSLTNLDEEKVISYEFKKTEKIILGYKCELLEVITNKGFHQYFFNRRLKSHPDNFKDHKMGLWNFFSDKTDGSLSLISINEIENFKSSIELISIDKKKLNDSIFIKPNLPIIKMPE